MLNKLHTLQESLNLRRKIMMHGGFGHFNNWICGPGAFIPGPFGVIITLLFWGLVFYLLIKVVGSLFRSDGSNGSSHIQTLKERYARGELSEDEYRRMKTELG